MVPGFTTSMKTRPLCVSKLVSYIHEKSVIIQSKRLMDELRVFVWKNGKAQSQNGYNDDLVMAFAIALFFTPSALSYATSFSVGLKMVICSILFVDIQ
jgi:hypothetical protein